MEKVETFVLNIGLSSPILDGKRVIEDILLGEYHVMKYEYQSGMWNGKEEETLIIQCKLDKSYPDLFKDIIYIAGALNQDCIAVYFPHAPFVSTLVYSNGYTGEKLKFSEEYFIKGRLLPQTKL